MNLTLLEKEEIRMAKSKKDRSPAVKYSLVTKKAGVITGAG